MLLLDEVFVSARFQILFVTKILPVIRGFQVNNVNPLNAIEMHLNAIYSGLLMLYIS